MTPSDLQWPFYELVSTFQEEWSRYHLWLYYKTDHYDWGWERNNYVIRSRDVKAEVTLDHFRFEIPRKRLTMISLGNQHNVIYRNRYVLGIHPNFKVPLLVEVNFPVVHLQAVLEEAVMSNTVSVIAVPERLFSWLLLSRTFASASYGRHSQPVLVAFKLARKVLPSV